MWQGRPGRSLKVLPADTASPAILLALSWILIRGREFFTTYELLHSDAAANRVLTISRQSETNLPLRLPGMPPVLRPTGSLCTTQGETHSTGLAIAPQRHLHAQSKSHRHRRYGTKEWIREQTWQHQELPHGTDNPPMSCLAKPC